jgi:hypothetical protein
MASGVDAERARQLLAATDGNLRAALGQLSREL